MSDYTLAVAWSGKDALSDSDSAKVISGDDFDSEFTTIRTAVNSKADIASPTLTGTPAAPTAAADTNTTQIATTAFVTTAAGALNAAAYPVGAIFTTTTAYADSAAVVTAIGGTTWVAFGAGKVLVGLDSGDTDFDTSAETGGAKTASGTSGSTTLSTSQIPSHTHTGAQSTGTSVSADAVGGQATYHVTSSTTTGSTGGGSGHTHSTSTSTVQPYIVVYFWKRTA
jgi:hypothetical protein